MSAIDLLKSCIPWPVRKLSRKLKRSIRRVRLRNASTEEIFTGIYARNMWGNGRPLDAEHPFYSGPGSDARFASPYADAVKEFISIHRIRNVVDLGCGDFRVGKLFVTPAVEYAGVDIVDPLISANRRCFASPNISFIRKNIIEDELPDGELCLIREVLQHLSNAQIQRVLVNVQKYRYVIVTDIHPGTIGAFKPNRDKPQGDDTRFANNSGLVFNQPPFNLSNVRAFIEVPIRSSAYHESNAVLRSFLITN